MSRYPFERTPLGARADWPVPLASAVSLIISAAVPMLLLWGREATVLYNDAFVEFAGDAHPSAFAKPVSQLWPDLASSHTEVLAQVFEGRCLSFRDQPMTILQDGRRDDRWLSFDYSPVRDEDGQVVGALCIINDTTERVSTEQKLRVAQTIGGIGTFEWFPETGRMIVSDEFRRIWGIEPDKDVTAQLLLSMLHPDDRAVMEDRIRNFQARNPIEYIEYRRLDPHTGAVHWIARRGEDVTTAESEQTRYIGISYDITERKRAEQEVRDTEGRWRNLFEQMQEGFFVGEVIEDGHGGIADFSIVESNPAFERQTRLAAEDLSAMTLRALIPQIQEDVIETFRRVLASGIPEDFELQLNRPEDEAAGPDRRWYEARARKVRQNRIGVLLLDVTARKTAEQAILESEAKFRLLAHSMPNHVWTAGGDGRVDWFNERVYDFAGITRGALDKINWVDLIHPEDLQRITEAWTSAVRNGHLYKAELRMRRRDGVYRWQIVRAVPVRNKSGAIKRWIGTNTDIDDQKSAEAALADFAATLEQRVEARTAELLKTQDALRQSQKMEAIGNLTGGIAHDFNNLLQVISGNLHLIAKDMTGHPKLEERLQNAIRGVTRGAKLASQLLAFGRRQPLAPKVINIGRLVHNMDDILHRALGEAITVETLIDDNLWNAEIDPGNVENAVLNMAINARDAMEDNGRLVIEVRNVIIDSYSMRGNMELNDGQYVMLGVKDNGCGMTAEVMEKVFEPFFTTKPEGKGTGLGLSMVYGFVKQSGGHVMIESQPGQGTTIRIYLPRAAGGEESEAQADLEGYAVKGGSETILVAEDDDAVLDTVAAILSDLGYRVLRAKDGTGALTILESGAKVDLLFSDVIMPGPLKSIDLVRKAREFQPGILVLFTSGYPEGSGQSRTEERGIELLQKPYSRQALALKVRRALDGPQLEKTPEPTPEPEMQPVAAGEMSAQLPTADKGQRIVILLCEDDYLIRLMTAQILEDEGYMVVEAGNGSEALDALAHYPVDLLLTDFGLPDMTGVELANRARAYRSGLPVIFATGHVEVENLPDGPTRQVTKPFTDTALLEAIRGLTG